jgi:hypothetical protein
LVIVPVKAGNKSAESVVVLQGKFQPFVLGKLGQGVPAGLVFRIGVDVGIIPEQIRAYPLTPQTFQALDGAGGAAGMEEEFHGGIIHRKAEKTQSSEKRSV